MAFPYFPHTGEDIATMLEKCGMKSVDDIYRDVPEEYIFKGEFSIPHAMSEMEVMDRLSALAEMNRRFTVFCGAGAYDHYSPAVTGYILSRSEFQTAYTPYQAEISQGTLRYIFEFQSMVCALTGLDCANASMYDGPTAAAEAMMMSVAALRRKSRILLSSALLPQVLEVVRTYASYHGMEVSMIGLDRCGTSLQSLKDALAAGDVAGVLVPGINRYGVIEDLEGFADAVHSAGALLSVYSDPSTLAVIRTPGEWGADIACGDAQTLGMPLSFGGPYAGFISCRMEYVRKLPGRIVGATRDRDGKRAFVLTLQAREQHIRREKATSNICSNQSLMALYATVYLSLMGKSGLEKVNALSCEGAHYLYGRLVSTGHFFPVTDRPFLKEFVLKTSLPYEELSRALEDAGFLAALRTEEGYVSFCVTERRSKEEIDRMLAVISSVSPV